MNPPSNAEEISIEDKVDSVAPGLSNLFFAENEAHTWSIQITCKYITDVLELPQVADQFRRNEWNGYNLVCLDSTHLGSLSLESRHFVQLVKHAQLLREKVLERAFGNLPPSVLEWSPVNVTAWLALSCSCSNVALNSLRANLDGRQLLYEPMEKLQSILGEGVEVNEFNTACDSIKELVTKYSSLVIPTVSSMHVEQVSSGSSDENIDLLMNSLDMSGIDFIRKANSTPNAPNAANLKGPTASSRETSQSEEKNAPARSYNTPEQGFGIASGNSSSSSGGGRYQFQLNQSDWAAKHNSQTFMDPMGSSQLPSYSYIDPMLMPQQQPQPVMQSFAAAGTPPIDRRVHGNSPGFMHQNINMQPSYQNMTAYPTGNNFMQGRSSPPSWVPTPQNAINVSPSQQYSMQPPVHQQQGPYMVRESDPFLQSFDQMNLRDSPSMSRQQYPLSVNNLQQPMQQYFPVQQSQQDLQGQPSYVNMLPQRPILTLPPAPQLLTRSPPRQQAFRQVNHPEVFPSATDFIYQVQFKRTFLYFVYYAESTQAFEPGDFVITECDRGEDLGMVVNIINLAIYHEHKHRDIKFLDEEVFRIRQIIRLANRYEREQLPIKFHDEQTVLQHCIDVVRNVFMLPMNVIDAEYQFDRTKLSVYYVSDVRIDFREVVRHVFATFQTRIWMKKSNRELNFEPIPYAATALTTGIAPNKASLFRGDLSRGIESSTAVGGTYNSGNASPGFSNSGSFWKDNSRGGGVGGDGF